MFIVKIKLDDTERGREENNHPNLAAKVFFHIYVNIKCIRSHMLCNSVSCLFKINIIL